MKIVNDNIPQDNKVMAAEQRQVNENKYVASIRPHNGHSVFEFDLSTGAIELAKIESVTNELNMEATVPKGYTKVISQGKTTVHKKVVQRPNCLYCSALNLKNALKRFIPMYAKLKAAGHIQPQEAPAEPKHNYIREDGEKVWIDWEVGGTVDKHDSACVDVWLTGEDQQGRKYGADGNTQDDELVDITNVEEVTND